MDFSAELNDIIRDDRPVSAARLTFLSDIGADERATLTLMWPAVGTERRRKIAATLVQVAEDNIEYDFYTVFRVLLGDPDPAVRRLAVEGLVEDESSNTLLRLIEVLEGDPDPGVRAAAANALGPSALRAETGSLRGDTPDRLRAALLDAARRPGGDEEVGRRALESVAYYCDNPEVEQEIERAYAGSGLLRASALHAMGRNMSRRWMPILLKELTNPQAVMRFEAAQALGELGERKNVPALVPLLEDDDSEVQFAAIWALGQLGGSVASQSLELLRADADEAVQEAVDEALTEIRYGSDPLGV
ncbi:MAG: HEAT repeat domain-containing protein [Chloroflexia bacterium]